MPWYCSKRTAFRTFAFAISSVTTTVTMALFIGATERSLAFTTYLLTALSILILSLVVSNRFVDSINRQFIRWFGRRRLRKAREHVALIIATGLYERQQYELPKDDDDLVIREAALNFADFY